MSGNEQSQGDAQVVMTGGRPVHDQSRTYCFGDVVIDRPVAIQETADGGHVVTDAEGAIWVVQNWNAVKIVPRRA